MKGKPLESKGLKIRPKPVPAGTVRMPRAFVADFQSVALHEGWDADYVADMKQWVRDNPPGMDYIATLALAYRNWYRPGPANGYVRVYAWLGQVGLAPVTIYTRVDISPPLPGQSSRNRRSMSRTEKKI